MTYLECEEYYEFYCESENNKHTALLKGFAFYNLESTAYATHGKNSDMQNYVQRLKLNQDDLEENNIEDQFEAYYGKRN